MLIGPIPPFDFLMHASRAVVPGRYHLQLRQTYAGYHIGVAYQVLGAQ
jgi:hypothetical protein